MISKTVKICNRCMLLAFLFFSTVVQAQIPQNIEVEGEPEQGWQYLLYILALLLVLGVIFWIFRIKKGKKRLNE